MTEYQFSLWDQVRVNGRSGEIVFRVPGDGQIPWYFVRFEDGTEDRFQADQLERE